MCTVPVNAEGWSLCGLRQQSLSLDMGTGMSELLWSCSRFVKIMSSLLFTGWEALLNNSTYLKKNKLKLSKIFSIVGIAETNKTTC